MNNKTMLMIIVLLIILVGIGSAYYHFSDTTSKLNFTTPNGYKVVNSSDNTLNITNKKTTINVDVNKNANKTAEDYRNTYYNKHNKKYKIKNISAQYNQTPVIGVVATKKKTNHTIYHYWYPKDNNIYHIYVEGKMNKTFNESTIEKIVTTTN